MSSSVPGSGAARGDGITGTYHRRGAHEWISKSTSPQDVDYASLDAASLTPARPPPSRPARRAPYAPASRGPSAHGTRVCAVRWAVCNARGLLAVASPARVVEGPWRGRRMISWLTLWTREVTDKHRACPHRPRCTILIDQCQSGSLSSICGVCRGALIREATRHCGVTSNHAMSAVQDPSLNRSLV